MSRSGYCEDYDEIRTYNLWRGAVDRAEVNWRDTRKTGGQNTPMAGAFMGRLECLEDLKNFLKGEND